MHFPPSRTLPGDTQERLRQQEPPMNTCQPQIQSTHTNMTDRFRLDRFPTIPDSLEFLMLGVASSVAITMAWRGRMKRIKTGEWITPDILVQKPWIRGVVTSVGYGGSFRLYHTPGIISLGTLKMWLNRDQKDQTIRIRIPGVSPPKRSRFGRLAQESLAWLKEHIEGKTVYFQPVRRDRHGRILAHTLIPDPRAKQRYTSLALKMLCAGMAEVYPKTGAEYGQWGRKAFLRAQTSAKQATKRMWMKDDGGDTPTEPHAPSTSASMPSLPSEEISITQRRQSDQDDKQPSDEPLIVRKDLEAKPHD